jgi:hypothetical protein
MGTIRSEHGRDVRSTVAPEHLAGSEHFPGDEFQYIEREAEYISAVVDSTGGLLTLEDVERVIALTHVLARVNQRIAHACR